MSVSSAVWQNIGEDVSMVFVLHSDSESSSDCKTSGSATLDFERNDMVVM